jgi:histidyl-tRNA synthetase
MSEKRQFRAIKGTRDILPPESALWNRVEQTAREVFESYGYGEIRLPIFEQTELFARSVGTDTDIVSKEMYTFSAYGAGDLDGSGTGVGAGGYGTGKLDGSGTGYGAALRPEATASVVRAYIEHGLHTRAGDVKLYYIGPMFRRERPQKGRYRQFYQIGAEVLGQSDAPAIDAELIEMLLVFFQRVGLDVPLASSGKGAKGQSDKQATDSATSPLRHSATLFINSIGCATCRPAYVKKLRAALEKVRNRLGADSQRRIETNPLRVLDSKLESEQAVIEKLPRIGEHLCADCRAHFARLEEELKLRGIGYEINWRLVRGLDYYMRTTFEITAPGLGAQNAVCGGGRYDGLVELLGGPPTKGIGFAIGTDRLVLSLQETGKGQAAAGVDVFIAWLGAAAYPAAVTLARRLRDAGARVELPAEETKLKKSLALADKLGARYAVLIGENELAAGKFVLRDLASGEQQQLAEGDLAAQLKERHKP